jgi:hypothetical protein
VDCFNLRLTHGFSVCCGLNRLCRLHVPVSNVETMWINGIINVSKFIYGIIYLGQLY